MSIIYWAFPDLIQYCGYMYVPIGTVPIAGQREALLLKDAKTLAKNMVKQLPASRHGEAGEAIAEAFLVEAKMQK